MNEYKILVKWQGGGNATQQKPFVVVLLHFINSHVVCQRVVDKIVNYLCL